MSDDKYPLVHRVSVGSCWLSDDGRWSSPCTEKVVPSDAIVIERSELPEVTVVSDGPGGTIRADAEDGQEYGGTWVRPELFRDPEAMCRSRAVEYLALAEYLRERPPADEAQVERVAEAIAAVAGATYGWQIVDRRKFAAALYARGVRVTEAGAK